MSIDPQIFDWESLAKESSRWVLLDEHPDYGKVIMMSCGGSEPYRWFKDKHGTITGIPLNSLPEVI